MSYRKLKLLGYEVGDNQYDTHAGLKKVVMFIEQNNLHMKDDGWIEQLDNENDTEKVKEMVVDYARICGVTVDEADSDDVIVHRIVNKAIDQIYYKNGSEYDNLTAEEYTRQINEKSAKSRNMDDPLNQIDYHSPEFASSVSSLCKSLDMVEHPDPIIALEAACMFISQNLNDERIKQYNIEKELGVVAKTFAFRDFDLGMDDPKDGAVIAAARILRLIGIDKLKKTQIKVNETLAAVQKLTVDPTKRKPNHDQARVGF